MYNGSVAPNNEFKSIRGSKTNRADAIKAYFCLINLVQIQKVLSVVISTITVIPIYYICTKFIKQKERNIDQPLLAGIQEVGNWPSAIISDA